MGDPDRDEGLHSLGHASGPDPLEIVRTMSPRALTTIHTKRPDYFVTSLKGEGTEVRLPERGQTIVLAS